MKVFEFEQKMKAEHGNVNLIYITELVYITTLKGRQSFSEVKNNKLVTYKSVDELKANSEQIKKYRTLPTFIVSCNGTDAAKWEIEQIISIDFLKKKLNMSNSEIAKFFELSPIAYANSSAKERYENALCSFYAFCKKENKMAQTDDVD